LEDLGTGISEARHPFSAPLAKSDSVSPSTPCYEKILPFLADGEEGGVETIREEAA